MKDFLAFLREQGVIGLAIGFILGGAVSKVVSSFVEDIVQPILGTLVGSSDGLSALAVGSVTYGNFLTVTIDFIIVAAVVFFIFKKMGLTKLDKDK